MTSVSNTPLSKLEDVRRPRKHTLGVNTKEACVSPFAHRSPGFLIRLNPDWRIVEDDLQYILQHRRGSVRSKATGWLSRSFCRTREVLLRCIREYCGSIDGEALLQVSAMPEQHRDVGDVGSAALQDQEEKY